MAPGSTSFNGSVLPDGWVFNGPGSATVKLGSFRLPTSPAPFFRCWGDASTRREQPYTSVRHDCSTEDYVFISGEQSAGFVEVSHTLISSKGLDPMRFYSLFEERFRRKDESIWGSEEDFTRFRCTTGNVRASLPAETPPSKPRAS